MEERILKRNILNISGEIDSFDFDLKKLVRMIVNETFKVVKVTTKHEINFFFTDNETIQYYNKQYRGRNMPTDVISFAYYDMDKTTYPSLLGEIIISNEKIIEQSKLYNHSILRECAFLICHGMLHILGYDHMNKEDEARMFNLQDIILNNLQITREQNEE